METNSSVKTPKLKSARGNWWSSLVFIKCPIPGCRHQVKRKIYMDRHLELHKTRPPRPHRCTFDNCEYSAALKNTLTNHIRKKHTPERTRAVQCPICPSSFYSKSDLKAHIGNHVKERIYKCDHCPYRTHKSTNLTIHNRAQHENLIPFRCPFPGCNYRTAYWTALKMHKRTHNPDPMERLPFSCTFPDCAYRTTTLQLLKAHARARHDPDRTREFPCPLCPKSFYTKCASQAHIRNAHVREQKYACDRCQYSTSRIYSLQDHCRRIHGEGEPVQKRLKCEQCDYRAFQKHWLDIHVLTKHLEERRLKCEHPGCNFVTNYEQNLKKHVLNHEDRLETQFPFQCSFPDCDFRRRAKAEMNAHERRHQSCKSELKCNLCPNRSYPDSKSLFFHKSLNHIKRTHKCSFCDYAVSFKAHLDNHVRLRHSDAGENLQILSVTVGPTRYTSSAAFGNNLVMLHDSSSRDLNAWDERWKLKQSIRHRFPVVTLRNICVQVL